MTLRQSRTGLLLAGAIEAILSGGDTHKLWWVVIVRVMVPAIYAGEYQAMWFPHAPTAVQWIQVQNYPAMMRNACFPRP